MYFVNSFIPNLPFLPPPPQKKKKQQAALGTNGSKHSVSIWIGLKIAF